MTQKADDAATHCLRVEQWPPLHRLAWDAAFRKGGLFNDPGPALHWRPATIEKTRKGYGACLDWIRVHDVVEREAFDASHPQDLVTRETVLAYVDQLARSRSSMTVYNRVQELYDAVRVMAPKHDWSWLKAAMDNLRAEAQPSRNKLARLKDAAKLEELGLKLMADAEAAPKRDYRARAGLTDLQRALAYRDGLMIALLIRRPFRIKNYCSLLIGDNFICEGEAVNFAFKPAEMKGKRPMDVPFPPHLLPHLRRYIAHYRLVLLHTSLKAPRRSSDALWISRDGTPMATVSLHNAIRRRTEEAYGTPLPPHWFRDAAVTSLVRDKPASARITGAILGHATPDIATKHYNQALMVDAGRRHTAMIEEMIEKFAADFQDPDLPPCAP